MFETLGVGGLEIHGCWFQPHSDGVLGAPIIPKNGKFKTQKKICATTNQILTIMVKLRKCLSSSYIPKGP
jgi:hypothetical protein